MALTVTPGYTWVDGEVETAVKLNLTATPTIAGNQSYAFGNGSSGAPSISFTSESTLGFYRASTGNVGLSGNLLAINSTTDSQLQFGQDATHNLNLLWTYNATAASASAVFGTFGKSNPLTIQASVLNFDTTSLAFALQLLASGRVRVGGGADDGANAFQVAGGIALSGVETSTNATEATAGGAGAYVLTGGLYAAKKIRANGGLIGSATNDSAVAGCIGEYISATVNAASAVSLTDSTSANVTSISLTAGDWDVFGDIRYQINTGSGVQISQMSAGLNTTTGTLPSQDTNQFSQLNYPSSNLLSPASLSTPLARFSLSGTTTVYLVANCSFTIAGNVTAAGFLRARRVR